MSAIFCEKIESLCSTLNSFVKTESEDDLHKSRVAARKLESLFRSFGHLSLNEKYKQYFSGTKELIKLLGVTRELDVCIGMTKDYLKLIKIQNYYLLLFLKNLERTDASKRKQIMKSDLLNNFVSEEIAMTEFFTSEFSSIDKTNLQKLFGFIIPEMYDKITDYIDRFIKKPDSKTLLHNMRIKSKPLRYNMEFAIEYCGMNLKHQHAGIKELVEIAGKIHDIDVLTSKLQMFERAASKVKNNYIRNKSVKIFISYLKGTRKQDIEKLHELLESFAKNKFREKLIKTLNFK
ncbi:MAG: CHAD domain-containing protein [Ignavibacteria bacterium]|nr:CHAD domain-containing protein [Ignavibacteria bacterium]